MTDYEPKPGVPCLITLRAVPDGEPTRPDVPVWWFHVRAMDTDGEPCDVIVHRDKVVRIEPAPIELPSGFGAVISATLHGIPDIRLVHLPDDPTDRYPWRTKARVPDCDCTPGVAPVEESCWHAGSSLTDVRVLAEGIPDGGEGR